MDQVIESIGEYIKAALHTGKPHIAKGILVDVEMWYDDHINSIHTAKKLMEDSVFMSIYCCGYENMDWLEVRSCLEVYFCNEIEDALLGKEEEVEDDENYENDSSDSE